MELERPVGKRGWSVRMTLDEFNDLARRPKTNVAYKRSARKRLYKRTPKTRRGRVR